MTQYYIIKKNTFKNGLGVDKEKTCIRKICFFIQQRKNHTS